MRSWTRSLLSRSSIRTRGASGTSCETAPSELYELPQGAEQPGRRRDIARIETLGERCKHRLEDRPSRRGSSLGLVHARKAGGRAQLPGQGPLRVRRFERLPKVAFRLGLRADLQCELAPYPEGLR